MNFDELHALIPYAKGGKEKVLTMSPYPNITLALPGRHAEQTVPKGGDFVVMITDPIYKNPLHQFTHDDIFNQVESMRVLNEPLAEVITNQYLKIVQGDSVPDKPIEGVKGIIDFNTFLNAMQCLAVAEHRRYHKYEAQFGGRYLPFRAAAGIADGKWTAAEASERTRKMGRPGVEWLESERGTPELTKELMK